MSTEITIFWNVTPCSLGGSCKHIGGTSCFQGHVPLRQCSRVYHSLWHHVQKIAISIVWDGLLLLYRLHAVQGTDNRTVIHRHTPC